MRVLTYNIAGHRGRGRREHLERVGDLIRGLSVDVVGLQEVIHHHHQPIPPEELLAELTGMHACYLPAHQFRRHCIGNAVLCREPIVETVSYELPHTYPERRILLEVDTTVSGLTVTIFCTHLVHLARLASRMRLAQATAVAKQMSLCWRPHLLVGDLNAGPNSRELDPVRSIAAPHDHLNGLRTWPARRPWLLYDHIWPGPGWEVEAVRMLDLHVSDHRPLYAELKWNGNPKYDETLAKVNAHSPGAR